MKYAFAAIVALVALVAVTGFAAADRLPNQTPENQVFSIDTVIDVTGAVDDKTTMARSLHPQEQSRPVSLDTSRQSLTSPTVTQS